MASLARILERACFWSYERGTWQYDLAVAVILLFVLGMPRRWFHDQPEVGMPATGGQVLIISREDHRQTYRVDARALAPPVQTPALQNELHNALQRSGPELRSGRFSIIRIEPVRNDAGTVVAYEVEVQR